MSEKNRNKKRKNKQHCITVPEQQHAPGEPTGNATTNLYITHCQNVQIGNKNVTVALTENSTDEPPFDLGREIILSYLSAKEKERNKSEDVSVQALETTFLKRQKSTKKHLSFKTLHKQKLLSYLRARAELYDVKQEGDHWTVKPTKQALEKYVQSRTNETEEEESSDGYTASNSKESCTPFQMHLRSEAAVSSPPLKEKDTSKGAVPKTYCTTRKLSPTPNEISQEETKLDEHDFRPQHIFQQPSDEIEKLMNAAKRFRQGHYILIHCEQKRFSYYESLSLIPWLAVFDFDKNGICSGLLSVVESQMKMMKPLNITTWKDQHSFTEGSVQWCFIRGSSNIPGSIPDSVSLRWSKDYKTSVNMCLERLDNFITDYTILTLFIIWPDEEKVGDLTDHMYKFVSRLDEVVEPASVILCDCGRKANSMPFKMLRKHLNKDTLEIIHLDLERICLDLKNELGNRIETTRAAHKLPARNETGEANVTDEDAAWLSSELEVLYSLFRCHKNMDPEDLKRESEDFFRGGTIAWSVRYQCRSEHLDAKRDNLETMVDKVKSYAENFKSETIWLSHAPGSGGTTFSQRLLWELKESFPCVQARLHTGTPVSELISRLDFLGRATLLPVVLLLDGEETQKVNHILRMTKDASLIILFVERYTDPIEEKLNYGSDFWLQGKVSESEARRLCLNLQEHCDEEEKKVALRKLSRDVTLGKSHYVYEFGLTAYNHEYIGVKSFVSGYLQLDKNPTPDLLPWQTVLGYMSLALYYGHSSMPCQFFRDKLRLPLNTLVTIEDFEYPMKEFIVPNRNEAKKNMVRICHVIIAKEILEQILTRHLSSPTKECTENLSKDARRNLDSFAIELVEYASKMNVKSGKSFNTVNEILTQIFIIRSGSNCEDQEAEFRSEHKPKLSRMMSDIECTKPYTERLNVFKKLTECFPHNPNFHAHLGRFYALYRKGNDQDEEEAMKCFNEALRLCRDELAKDVEAVNDQVKTILKHIYHMYGMMYFWRIRQYTGKYHGDKHKCQTTKAQFETRVEMLRQMALTACNHFADSRRYCPKSAFDTFGYCGEINVRLQISDFTQCHINQNLIEFIHSKRDELSDLKLFIRESIIEISDLIRECLHNNETTEIDSNLYTCIQWYQMLFKMESCYIRHFIVPNNVVNRRLQIASIKLKYREAFDRAGLEHVTFERDITEIVEHYEELFRYIRSHGIKVNQKSLDMDYKEWIVAIRHSHYSKDHRIEDVLVHIKQWNSKVNSLCSKYYLFIMYSLLGLGHEGTGGNIEMMNLAMDVKLELCKMGRASFMHSNYPWEWYGKGTHIKSLFNGNRFGSLLKGRTLVVSDSHSSQDVAKLVIMKGTVCKTMTTTTMGYINMDIERSSISIAVAFIPAKPNLGKRIQVGDRVEFLLGFSIIHGFEAFNVKILLKLKCNCGLPVEFKSDENLNKCECGENVYRMDAMV